MKIGPRFREFRERKHLKQADVANLTSQVRQAIQRFEGEEYNPTIAHLQKNLRAIGVSLAEFFESRIPEAYADPLHAELHDKLQFILERGGDRMVGIRVNIEDLYRAAIAAPVPPETEEVPRGVPPKRSRRLRKTG